MIWISVAALFERYSTVNPELYKLYLKTLAGLLNAQLGQQVFREKCSKCHQAHGIGYAVGPDLNAAFQRAEVTILKDVLAPSESISAGFITYILQTHSGQVNSGLLGAGTPTSLMIRMPDGRQETILRTATLLLKDLQLVVSHPQKSRVG